MQSEALVDRIYEAGAVPELWPTVLDLISDLIGGVGGQLIAVRNGYATAISTKSLLHINDLFVSEGWSERDPRMMRGRAINHPGFVNDGDLLTDVEIATNDVYENFYRKHGVGYMAGTIITNPTGDTCAFTLQRNQDRGPVPRDTIAFLDVLRPHLARASMLSFRLGLERARAQTNALQLIGLPGAVLRRNGTLKAANASFQKLIPSVVIDRRERVTLASGGADKLLADALTQFRTALGPTTQRASIPIPAGDDRLPMIVHLVPIKGTTNDIFSDVASLLIVTPVDRAAVPTAEVLQGLFDLTPAEARVARGIGEARTVDAIALINGTTRETVRSQLKSVLSKTGLSRQQELVSLLAGSSLIP